MKINKNECEDYLYCIEAKIGAGSGGTVYKAWHARLQKYVVIKETPSEYETLNRYFKRCLSGAIETPCIEADALKNVKSPYLPQVYDIIEESGHVYTIMEYIEGESFDKLLERGRRFAQAEIVKWYSQLASALRIIHEQDVCHRDIKPANIMLTLDGDICLIDFNAAIVSGKSARFISRSPGYASPEQNEIFERIEHSRHENDRICHYRNKPTQSDMGNKTELSSDDPLHPIVWPESMRKRIMNTKDTQPADSIDWKRSDIYSLGATMYHILTEKRPQERASEIISISKLGYFDAELTRIIEKSMQPEPSDRFASASELATSIRSLNAIRG